MQVILYPFLFKFSITKDCISSFLAPYPHLWHISLTKWIISPFGFELIVILLGSIGSDEHAPIFIIN